jgi:hypothetical protein
MSTQEQHFLSLQEKKKMKVNDIEVLKSLLEKKNIILPSEVSIERDCILSSKIEKLEREK